MWRMRKQSIPGQCGLEKARPRTSFSWRWFRRISWCIRRRRQCILVVLYGAPMVWCSVVRVVAASKHRGASWKGFPGVGSQWSSWHRWGTMLPGLQLVRLTSSCQWVLVNDGLACGSASLPWGEVFDVEEVLFEFVPIGCGMARPWVVVSVWGIGSLVVEVARCLRCWEFVGDWSWGIACWPGRGWSWVW